MLDMPTLITSWVFVGTINCMSICSCRNNQNIPDFKYLSYRSCPALTGIGSPQRAFLAYCIAIWPATWAKLLLVQSVDHEGCSILLVQDDGKSHSEERSSLCNCVRSLWIKIGLWIQQALAQETALLQKGNTQLLNHLIRRFGNERLRRLRVDALSVPVTEMLINIHNQYCNKCGESFLFRTANAKLKHTACMKGSAEHLPFSLDVPVQQALWLKPLEDHDLDW